MWPLHYHFRSSFVWCARFMQFVCPFLPLGWSPVPGSFLFSIGSEQCSPCNISSVHFQTRQPTWVGCAGALEASWRLSSPGRVAAKAGFLLYIRIPIPLMQKTASHNFACCQPLTVPFLHLSRLFPSGHLRRPLFVVLWLSPFHRWLPPVTCGRPVVLI